ncbi:hypothetical protein DU002_19105 [Corallincola holothuriorum]|uniref:Uncharacterized protein n=1 Tax=Corallincola holothuriorum TaxID=2282215 RepID=A0A368N0V2_9GAMM|nr:hypothetical protein [Corallincola holothuriorum]RCU42879.1 hypothetical protein DU002_19105 [Corallincola holothuriorum]
MEMKHSRKAKEVHAEYLMKLSTSLMTAFLVAILILPISAVVGSALSNQPTIDALTAFRNLFGTWYSLVFILAEVCIYYLVLSTKKQALEIYNELYPDS